MNSKRKQPVEAGGGPHTHVVYRRHLSGRMIGDFHAAWRSATVDLLEIGTEIYLLFTCIREQRHRLLSFRYGVAVVHH